MSVKGLVTYIYITMSAIIRTLNTFSASDVTFGPVLKNKMGGKAVYINSSSGGRLMFQLPPMKAPFGLSEYVDKATGNVTSTSLPLNLDTPELLKTFQMIDDLVIDHIVKNSEELLGKKTTKEILMGGDSYKSIVKQPSKEGYKPFISLKVITDKEGKITTSVYDSKRRETTLQAVEKKQMCHTIIDINQIWRTPAGVGVSIKLVQVMLGATDGLKECAFAGVESEGEDEIEVDGE